MTAIDLAELVDQNMHVARLASLAVLRAMLRPISIRGESERGDFSLRQTSTGHFRERDQLNSAGNDIERDDLVYSINEPDNYAVEEALQIVDRAGGNVTVVTVGGERTKRSCAARWPWAQTVACCISDEAFERLGRQRHRGHPEGFRRKGQLRPDTDRGPGRGRRAQVGGMLAAMLDYPFASLVNSIEVPDGTG